MQVQEIEDLASRVNTFIQTQMKHLGLGVAKEIQIDCDWTAATHDDYFKFLELLKKESSVPMSVTLRLHLVKDRDKTGIPPVDRVYLMCYATSSPLENSDHNSILDLGILKNYLAHIQDYPIKKMTVALPIYSWDIIENHLGKHKLINGLTR